MAKKQKATRKVEWQGWVSTYLTKEDKKRIKDAVIDAGERMDLIQELIEDGYTVKIQWDAYAGTLSVMLMGGADAGANAGWGMSARHNDLTTALDILLYQNQAFSNDESGWVKPSEVGSEFDW